jgi:acylphosphatase
MKKVCDSAGVIGWVRNRPDGSVEALLQGDENGIRKVLDWSKRGPERARVSRVETRDTVFNESMKSFEIVG